MNVALRKIFGSKRRKVTGDLKNFIVRSFQCVFLDKHHSDDQIKTCDGGKYGRIGEKINA
jgi:hypothetical protein